jgi:hypothetical protein
MRNTEDDTAGVERAYKSRHFVWITVGEIRYTGFAIASSPSIVLVKRVHEFVAMGFLVIRRSSIEDVTFDRPNIAFADRVLRIEGLGPAPDDPQLVLDSMTSALASLPSKSMVMAERLNGEHDDRRDILVGEIFSVDDLRLRIRHVDTTGERDGELSELRVPEIAVVEFNSPYLRIFQKYAVDPAPG